MAIIRFAVQLIGGDLATLPVTITTPLPVSLTLVGGPQVIGFSVLNSLSRPVVLENLSAIVTVGDGTMLDVTLLDTVLSLGGGVSVNSSLTVTPNQEIPEGLAFEIEITGAEVVV